MDMGVDRPSAFRPDILPAIMQRRASGPGAGRLCRSVLVALLSRLLSAWWTGNTANIGRFLTGLSGSGIDHGPAGSSV